jgi:hypothetical protein
VVVYCPRCGAEVVAIVPAYLRVTDDRCRECGLAMAPVPPMLAPSDDEVSYGLDEWPPGDRGAVTAGLSERGIPYRWEADLVLIVPEATEQTVDLLLDEIEDAADAAEAQAEADASSADGGPEAQAAMAELFVIADRLHHVPFDAALALEFEKAADRVAVSLPPYGIDTSLWRQIQELAAETISETRVLYNDDAVAERSGVLRDLLREFV